MNISKDIKALRQKAGLSQNALAKLSGVKQCQISKIEGGGNCKFFTAVRLLSAMGYKLVITMLEPEDDGKDKFNKLEMLLILFTFVYLGGHVVAYLIR